MSAPVVVQRFTPPQNCLMISMKRSSDGQAGVHIRDLYKEKKTKQPEEQDFTVPYWATASFADTLDWDTRMAIEDLPRIWRASRRVGRFILIVMGGGGSCLVAEVIQPDEELTANTLVRVHPYPLHLSINRSLEHGDVRYGIQAGNHRAESHIKVCADPGTGPDGTPPSSTLVPGPPITSSQEMTILSALDLEITAWGEIFTAAHQQNQSGQAGWPSELCRNVLPSKDRASEISKILQAVGIRGFEKFAGDSINELVVSIYAPDRPSALIEGDTHPWSAFINLRNETVTEPMKLWIEATLRSVFARKWPDGWYEGIGPATTSRLGVSSQMRKTTATITGSFSNHQKIEVMGILGTLY